MQDFASQLFGSPAGLRLGNEDVQRIGINNLNQMQMAQHLQQAEQMNPMLLQHQSLENQTAQLGLTQRQAAIDAYGKMSDADKADPVKMLIGQANVAAAGGNMQLSGQLFGQAQNYVTRGARADYYRAQAADSQLKADGHFLELAGRYMGDVTDQASWERAVGNIEASLGGRKTYLSDMQYSPENVARLKKEALTEQQRVNNDRLQNQYESQERARKSAEDFRKFRENYMNWQMKHGNEMEERRAKAGGKPVGSPSQVEVDQARMVILADMPQYNVKLGDNATQDDRLRAAELGRVSGEVAGHAKKLRADNPALGWDESINRAWADIRQNYQTTPGEPAKTMHIPIIGDITTKAAKPDTQKYQAPGSMANPRDIRSIKDKDLVDGEFYHDGAGRVMKWDAKNKRPILVKSGGTQPIAPTTGPNGESADEMSDDEEGVMQ